MKKALSISILCILFFLVIHPCYGDTPKQNIKTLVPKLAAKPPVIDGSLDDEIWREGPIVDDIFITYNPLYGDVLPHRTAVYMAYDPDTIYVAFYCYDSEPEMIKTSVTKHDNVWDDDWVGFSLDTVGGRQFAYEFFMNPYGMQGDIYNTSSTGEDSSPDYVWESKGQVVKDGYIVEVAIPLKNFRFNAGENVEMLILFWRRISRLGISGSWPEIKPAESILSSASEVVFGKLDKQLMLEFIPAVTYSSRWDRETPEEWSDPDDKLDFGITGKYGVTSSITAEFTINPDYSQVESDAFVVTVNQRYPIFYSEKRPFFMEAGGLFDIAGTSNGDWNMARAVHTRRIVDPQFGLKLSGETGNFAFGLLTAGDEAPGRELIDGEPNPFEGEMSYFTAGRAKLSIGKGSYIGAIFTNLDFVEGYNRVAGLDFKTRFDGHIIGGHFLYSSSRDEETLEESDGSAWVLTWDYSTRPLGACLWWEHLDEDFRMDSAFITRLGMDKFTAYFGPSFYPTDEKWSWLKRINPFIWGYVVHDLETGEDDYFYLFSVRLYTTKKGWIRFDYRGFSEYWYGEQLEGSYFWTQGSVEWTNWLGMSMYLALGDGPYYDTESPVVGDRITFNIDCTIQPTGNLTQYFDYTYNRLNSKIDGSKIYDVNIFRSRTTYQFDEHLFFRAYVQYDSYREIVLSDLLLSYQLVPGTVLHLGYGSYHENLSWINNEWKDPAEFAEYYQTTQSIFFKASYLINF